MRRPAIAIALVALLAATRDARAQMPLDAGVPQGPPELVGLSPVERDALRPLALRGAAVLVRDADSGARARVTVLVRANAPVSTVHRVITTPEAYTAFMPTLTRVDIVSRRGPRVAFRFHVAAAIFDVTILSALADVGTRRIDVSIVQSDTGPGASRWDLVPDGDGTLIALSTWGDPSRGSWFLRQIAARSENAIAGMNISADTILALGVARRAEILEGARLPPRPPLRSVPSGPLAPPPAGPWMSLPHDVVVGAVSLDAQGAMQQTSVAMWSPVDVESMCTRLVDVRHYARYWPVIHDQAIESSSGNTVRYRYAVQSTFSTTHGEEERSLEHTSAGPVVRWHGVSGDYANTDHRWDLFGGPAGDTLVVFTGGSEYARASLVSRTMMDRDVWFAPGYAMSFLMVWMRAVVDR